MLAPPEDPTSDDGRRALLRLVRSEGSRVLATLTRVTGSLELAEDAVQDAVVRALEVWPTSGVPPEPRAWLTVVARNRAIDLMRREANRVTKEGAARLLDADPEGRAASPGAADDDMLRLLFTCCHPSLGTEAQTALALRTLCGLTTAEVARALLVSEATMAKRLTRARRKIAVAHIPYRTPGPDEWPERLSGVLATVYLLFNEGYQASSGDDLIRLSLTEEAIRLGRLICALLPDEASPVGLLALMLLQSSRHAARVDDSGEIVLLADQDRSRWDRAAIAEGMTLLGIALRRTPTRPELYATQAAIAACHALAPTWEETSWDAVLSWYNVLLTIHDTPVVRVNRAVAVAQLDGPQAGLDALDELDASDSLRSPTVQSAAEAVRGDLLGQLDQRALAAEAYRRALAVTVNGARRRHLVRRLADCASPPAPS